MQRLAGTVQGGDVFYWLNPLAAGIFFGVVTIGFALGLPRVQLQTIFSDLLPRDDPFVQVYKDHPNFGNPQVTDVETIGPDSPFGKINTTVGQPRLIQFSLRYSF